MHNDSGDEARLYAVKTDGALLGTVRLNDVEAVDFEDLALGACPGKEGWCLWVGDVGDNDRERDQIFIYGIEEPELEDLSPQQETALAVSWTHSLSYPDGPVDCEALVVAQGSFWLFEKSAGDEARLFQLPNVQPADGAQTLSLATSFPSPGVDVPQGRLITAADWDEVHRRLAIRTYTGSFLYEAAEGQSLGDIFGVEAVPIAYGPLSETQGEAIAFEADGPGIWTISEAVGGGLPIHYYPCQTEP
jgi:hypothetical protein